jgi:ribosomal protein S27E
VPEDAREDAYYPPRSVELFLGYQNCSLQHPRCPSCRKINYAIVSPDNGYALSWYQNVTPQNPNGFFIDIECVHCAAKFVVEWDELPIKNKFCNYCSKLGVGIEFCLLPESGRQEFEANYGGAPQLRSPIKKGNGEAIWLVCQPCMNVFWFGAAASVQPFRKG